MLTSFVCAALLAPQLHAQSTTRSDWVVSFGMDPSKMIGHFNPEENFVASLGRQWARANSGLGLRAQLAVGAQPSQNLLFNYPQCASCVINRARQFAELSGTAVYTFRRNKNIRPYLLGGPALYGVRNSFDRDGLSFSSRTWSLGGTFGAGVSFKLLGKEFQIEQRFITSETSSQARDAYKSSPLSIGIKF